MKDLFEQFSNPSHRTPKNDNCDYTASQFEQEHKLKTLLNGWDEQCPLTPMEMED